MGDYATVKVDGKVYECSDVKVLSYNNTVEVQLCNDSKIVASLKYSADRPVKFKVNGNVKQVKIGNVVAVSGRVNNAQVGNCLSVHGFVKDYKTPSGTIKQKNYYDMDFPDIDKTINGKKARVFTFFGELNRFVDSLTCGCVQYHIFGTVDSLSCRNCAYVEGEVTKADVGNMLYCDFGVKGKPKKTVQQQDMSGIFDDIFKNLEFKE